MANITAELAAIMAAIYGEQVRGSIHDAIRKINDYNDHAINAGTAIADNDPVAAPYTSEDVGAIYFNTNSNDLLVCDGSKWNAVDNLAGNSITSITKTDTSGLVDTYTISFSKTSPVTFDVTNGQGIVSITGPTTVGLVDTYTITYTDGTTSTFDVTNGKGIASIAKTATAGLIDTYTITYNDGTTLDYYVTNGKDGNTVLRGNEVTGQVVNPTQFTLSVKCQAGDTYINNTGYVYICTNGAAANDPSLWSYSFAMAGGGVQYLNDLNDVNTTGAVTGQILAFNGTNWVPISGGSGHTMTPDPATHPTEAQVVSAVNVATDVNNHVASLFGIQRWSNKKTIRVMLDGAGGGIGHYGVGEWQPAVSNPTLAQETAWGWWQNDAFKLLEPGATEGYDVDFQFKYDPRGGEPILMGGYILDTTTGCMCIKFANYVLNPAAAKIFVDITFTRNDYPTPSV